jgi:hypothetical protein
MSSTAREVIGTYNRARRAGMCILIGLDNDLYIWPGHLADKHPQLAAEIHHHREGMTRWLQILARPTSHAI